MNILKYKKMYLILSIVVLLPGILSLIIFGLNLSIDFIGGSLVKYSLPKDVNIEQVVEVYNKKSVTVESKSKSDGNVYIIRTNVTPNVNVCTLTSPNGGLYFKQETIAYEIIDEVSVFQYIWYE